MKYKVHFIFGRDGNQTFPVLHWNKNVVILTKFSSLAALEVVILTTSSAASDEHFIKMKTFPFQCILLPEASEINLAYQAGSC